MSERERTHAGRASAREPDGDGVRGRSPRDVMSDERPLTARRSSHPVGEVLAAARDVDGWMTDGQGRRLYEAAARCPTGGRIVEIGSFRGRSTIVLALAAGPDVEVVAIDPHAGNDRGPQELSGFETEAASDRAAFEANLRRAGVADRVRHIAAFSDAAHGAVDGPIDVLHIDGAHRYAPARADIRDWGRRVTDGGTLLIHDAFSSIGVTAAIGRELVAGPRFRYVGRTRSLAEYRADLAGHGRPANAGRQLAQLPWFARNVALKISLTLGLGAVLRRLGRTPPEWPY
jgi:predicted O-methyltransferase YrrM